MQVPYLAWFMLALGLFNMAHWVYPATGSTISPASRSAGNEGMIGLALVRRGRWLRRRAGRAHRPADQAASAPTRMAMFGFIICAITFAAYAGATQGWMIFVIIPFGALAGVLGPSINQIMSVRTPRNAQGELQGAIASVQSLSNIFAPLMLTQVFHYYTSPAAPVYFPGAAFALAAIICTISLLPLMRGLKTAPKLEDQPPDPAGEAPPPETSGETPAPAAAAQTA